MRLTYGLKQTIDNFALDYEGSRFTQALIENGIKREVLMFDKNKKQFIPMKNERMINEIKK